MKKNVLVLLLAAAPFFGAKSQAFQIEDNFVNVGYGFGNITQTLIKTAVNESNDVNASATSLGPIFLKFEHALADNIGIGLNVAYASANAIYRYDNQTITDGSALLVEELNWSSTSFLLRFNYHFGQNDKIDPYLGLGAGYRTGNWDATNNDPQRDETSLEILSPVNFGLDMTFGSRFLFTENFGAYVEVGLAKAVIQGGLTVKF